MVKTNRFSRGPSSGFGFDHHRGVDNRSDSEGFGSSGRVDTEMAASEGSCAPKRKCISLNVEKCDYFGVPSQVISLAKMRQWEKKDLKLRLRAELDQVRVFRKKISMRFTNGVALSSSSVIHSSSDIQKVLPVHSSQKPSGILSGKAKKSGILSGNGTGKKRAAAPVQGNALQLKRGNVGRFESVNQVSSSSTSHVMLMNQCDSLLQRVMAHQYGSVFNVPVDVAKFKIPDYFNVIKHPMDLGTVKKKLTSGVYSGPQDFVADVRLTFSNAMTYNPPGNSVHSMAATLSKYFELRWKPIEKKITVSESMPLPVKPVVPREVEFAKEMPPVKKRKIAPVEHKVKPDIVKKAMSREEKHALSRDLENLIAELPAHIIDFLRERSFNASQTGDDEIEVDIDDLSDDSLLTLRKLVDDYLREKQMNQPKAKPFEMEIPNDVRLGGSSIQPGKGNNPVDEDVDIGDNDPPVLSYPPVEIEKDTAHRNSSSSSSSSSSDSGSSSSDSDSGNSSGSSAKPSSPAPRIKETLNSGEVLVPKRSDPIDRYDGNQADSCLDQLEQTSQPRPVSVEADSRQEEESTTPSERQVSPGKLYRAALLRGRFADTILKARAKTLDPGKKGDPEKLRREKEELERQQREEKARLQAEAKAAEEARKQAEAEAAAEAKRKRQLEREAARQALLKMEKTVEINGNCPLLEDLEMLRVAPVEHHIPSSVDESSPTYSEDGMGGFRLRGSTNPLEQLGLYMKVDEEEEDEEEGEADRRTTHDVEEGEID